MTDLERLIAIDAIKQLKARYFRGLDTQDWDLLATVFAEDATFDFSEANHDPNFPDPNRVATAPVTGAREILGGIKATITGFNSVHHGHMPEIDVTSENTASGIWPMEEHMRDTTGRVQLERNGFGYYYETYEKIDGEWRIKSSRIKRLRVDFIAQH